MKARVFATELQFKFPFVLAAGTRSTTPVVFLNLADDRHSGWSEAALPPYFGLTPAQVIEHIKTVDFSESIFSDAMVLNETLQKNLSMPQPVKSLLVSAACNLNGMNAVTTGTYQCTLTVSPSPDADIKKLLGDQDRFSVIKIKAGTTHEREFIEHVLNHTDKPFCIDVNRGWKNRDTAATFCEWLLKKGCLLVEQPFEKNDFESHYWLRKRVALPVIADEGIGTFTDLVSYYDAFDGVNVKLLKCGGPIEAKKMIEFARGKKLKTLLGCMSESSLGCGTAASLAHLVDYADLDGPYLIKNDPFEGYTIREGTINMETYGVRPTENFITTFSSLALTL